MMRTRFAAAAALTLMAAVAAGCGSSGDEGTSKADFVKQANAVCAKGNDQIEASAKETFGSGGRPDKAAVTKFVKGSVIPTTRKTVDGISKLDPPKGDEDKIKAITDAADEGLDKVEANPALAAIENGPRDPFGEVDKLAGDYGLKSCAN